MSQSQSPPDENGNGVKSLMKETGEGLMEQIKKLTAQAGPDSIEQLVGAYATLVNTARGR